jgi:hypothetical protein
MKTRRVKIEIEVEVPVDCDRFAVDQWGTPWGFSERADVTPLESRWSFKHGYGVPLFVSNWKETLKGVEK